MLAFFASCFHRVLSAGEIVELTVGHNTTTSAAASQFIYRDELSSKITKQKPSKLKNYYNGVSYSSSKPLLKVNKLGDDDDGDKAAGKRSCGDDAGSGRRRFDDDIGKATGTATATMRVKVKMTKEEAARLLSKCKDGGVIEFRDVARELVNLPVHRVSVVSPCPAPSPATNPMLDTIPEESS